MLTQQCDQQRCLHGRRDVGTSPPCCHPAGPFPAPPAPPCVQRTPGKAASLSCTSRRHEPAVPAPPRAPCLLPRRLLQQLLLSAGPLATDTPGLLSFENGFHLIHEGHRHQIQNSGSTACLPQNSTIRYFFWPLWFPTRSLRSHHCPQERSCVFPHCFQDFFSFKF